MTSTAALIYVAICGAVILFQFCLIAGAPWGKLTQRGAHAGQLPTQARIGAGVSIVLMGLAIISAAGFWPRWPLWTGWTALAITVVSVIMNLITPSKPERMLWGPVTLIMLALAVTVMFTR